MGRPSTSMVVLFLLSRDSAFSSGLGYFGARLKVLPRSIPFPLSRSPWISGTGSRCGSSHGLNGKGGSATVSLIEVVYEVLLVRNSRSLF